MAYGDVERKRITPAMAWTSSPHATAQYSSDVTPLEHGPRTTRSYGFIPDPETGGGTVYEEVPSLIFDHGGRGYETGLPPGYADWTPGMDFLPQALSLGGFDTMTLPGDGGITWTIGTAIDAGSSRAGSQVYMFGGEYEVPSGGNTWWTGYRYGGIISGYTSGQSLRDTHSHPYLTADLDLPGGWTIGGTFKIEETMTDYDSSDFKIRAGWQGGF